MLSVGAVIARILEGVLLLAVLGCVNPFKLPQSSAMPQRGQSGGGSNDGEKLMLGLALDRSQLHVVFAAEGTVAAMTSSCDHTSKA